MEEKDWKTMLATNPPRQYLAYRDRNTILRGVWEAQCLPTKQTNGVEWICLQWISIDRELKLRSSGSHPSLSRTQLLKSSNSRNISYHICDNNSKWYESYIFVLTKVWNYILNNISICPFPSQLQITILEKRKMI